MPLGMRLDHPGLLMRARNMGPTVVFVMTFILTGVSIFGTVIVLLTYSAQGSNANLGASQSVTLLSAAVSFVFVGLYLLAARRNKPVSRSRPPKLPLHRACFIIMRITALLWTAAMIVALGTRSNLASCQENSRLCELQKIDVILSILAVLVTIVILFGLENCEEPFKTPSVLKIQPRIICRISQFDDILERSISRRSSFGTRVVEEQERMYPIVPQRVRRNKEYSVSKTAFCVPSNISNASTLLESVEQQEKQPFHLLRTHHCHRSGCLERLSRQLRTDRRLSQSGRSITINSAWSQTQHSIGSSVASGASHICGSSSRSSSRIKASPSSSISNYSRRSPLSTMRTIENPEILIDTDVHVCSNLLDYSPQSRFLLRQSVVKCVAPATTAHPRPWRKRINARAPIELRRQTVQSRNISADMDCTAAKVSGHRLTTKDSIIGGSFPGENLNNIRVRSVESTLDGHSRIIEASIKAAVKCRKQTQQRRREQEIQDAVVTEELFNRGRPRAQEDET